MEQPIAARARKHGVSDDDILHAFNNPTRAEDLDEGLTMLIGPDHAGNLYEIGVSSRGRAGHRPRHARPTDVLR